MTLFELIIMRTYFVLFIALLSSCAAPTYVVNSSDDFKREKSFTVYINKNDPLAIGKGIESSLFNNGFDVISSYTSLDKQVLDQNINNQNSNVNNKSELYRGREISSDYAITYEYEIFEGLYNEVSTKHIKELIIKVVNVSNGKIISTSKFTQNSRVDKIDKSINNLIFRLKNY